jgi:Ca2+-transporting ATPase
MENKGSQPSNSWHTLSVAELLKEIRTDRNRGLSAVEVEKRQVQFGKNSIEQKAGKPKFLRFLEQFNQPLLYILILAGVIKATLGQWINAWVIWGVVWINATVGFIQEMKAESAIAALSSSLETNATICRDGQKIQIPSSQIVPGDLVFLTSGDKVPADLRLIQTKNLQINESGLTGESTAVEKQTHPVRPDTPLAERRNMAYAGSFVTSGRATGIVVAIGQDTETGRISQLMQKQPNLTTPLTRKFDRFSRQLLYIILGIAGLTFTVGLGYGANWPSMLEATVALAVSAIPEGLPAVVTIALAIGVGRMARRHAIIRKLPAVETLGSATTICSDKTGTLTENQMTVQGIYAGGRHYTVSGTGYNPEGEVYCEGVEIDLKRTPVLKNCAIAGLLCNDSHLERREGTYKPIGDPTEIAPIVLAVKLGLDPVALERQWPRLDAIPFESEHQYMATLHRRPDGESPIVYVKGSAEAVLSRCEWAFNVDNQLELLKSDKIHAIVDEFADRGLRVLAFAQKTLDSDSLEEEAVAGGLQLLGLQATIDPPREDAIRAIAACKEAGIRVKMITGDHPLTARAIATQMKLKRDGAIVTFTGRQLAGMNPVELEKAAVEGVVFARVAPEQKLQLVEALQAQGEVVAMTGDGVNDAPALKQADIGVAMGKTGTEVAKEAADIVLTDDNFASIEAAVEEGRTVYRNLIKAISFILPVNGGESMTILLSVLLGQADRLPILSLQVLWLNMINSIAMTVPLAFEAKSARVMQNPPIHADRPLLNRSLLQRIGLISISNWIVIFGMFEAIDRATGNIDLARTMAIQALIAGRIFYLISLSQWSKSLWDRGSGKSVQIEPAPILWVGIGVTVALQVLFSQLPIFNLLFATYPLTPNQWLICFAVGLPTIAIAAIANRLDPQDDRV